MDGQARIKSILQANMHMVLSTADETGRPWATPVTYAADDNNVLYWTSSKDARHSVNIRARKELAIVVYMLEPVRDALYIEAEAHELTDNDEILQAIEVIKTRPQPDKYRITSPQAVSGQAAWRIYAAAPKAMYVRKEVEVNGQAVTVRRAVS